MIESYNFGRMKVDGNTFTNDLKIFPSGIKEDWWRDEGHLLQVQDLKDVLEEKPSLLVIGQGAQGRMKIDPEVEKRLREEGIDYVADKTEKAVEKFNESDVEDKVGVFHLTC